jgi:hypothetical protein
MKKIKYLLLLCVLAIVTTGCVKFNVNMDIKKDKSMEFSVIYAFDKSMMGESNSLKEEDFDAAKKEGFAVSKYSQDNYEGFKLTKKIANIDEVSTEADVTYDLSGLMGEGDGNKYIFKVVKGTDKNTYIAKIKFDSDSGNNPSDNTVTTDEETIDSDTNETDGELAPDEVLEPDDYDFPDEELTTTSKNDDMDLSALMNNLDLSFNVSLPYGAVSSNATTKENDNKNLSWKLGASGEQYIEFTFELKNNEGSSNLILYIGIGVAALLVIVVLAIVLTKKKNKPVTEVVPEAPKAEVTEEQNN